MLKENLSKVRTLSYVLFISGDFSRLNNLFVEVFVLYRSILINQCREILAFIFPYSNPLSESGNTLFYLI